MARRNVAGRRSVIWRRRRGRIATGLCASLAPCLLGATLSGAVLDPAKLEASGMDEITGLMVTAAFTRAGRDLAAIEAGAADPSADPDDVARARRRVHEELVETIGVEHVLAGRHAGGLDNRVSVASVPADGTAESIGLRAGDVLLAVDEHRVFDLDDVRRLDIGPPYELELRRSGATVRATLERPLSRLALRAESVPPAAFGN